MKRIVNVLFFLLTLIFLAACQPINDEAIEFKNLKDKFEIYLNSEHPDYMADLEVIYTKDQTNLNEFVTVDQTNIDLSTVGTYEVIYHVSYEDAEATKGVPVHVIDENTVIREKQTITTYYLNDLHGALLENDKLEVPQMGITKIGNLILDEKTKKPDNTLFIAGGDMLQGQLISNHFDGASTIDLLNDMKLDAFVIGNHEFDWGLDTVLQYFDGRSHLQATFPLLGANVYYKGTENRPNGIEPYTIVVENGVKIGIIGVIGQLESSISHEFIKEYTLSNPLDSVKYYSDYLRTVEAVDSVYVVTHNGTGYYTEQVSKLTGSEHVDVMFEAHTHYTYANKDYGIPLIQSGSSGTHVGQVIVNYDENGQITSSSVENLDSYDDARLNVENEILKEKLAEYYDVIRTLLEEPILTSSANYSTIELTEYIAKTMRQYYGVDIAFHNTGGTRAPLAKGETITYDTLLKILPFDNQIITLEMTGSDIRNLVSSYRASRYSLDPIHSDIYTLDSSTYYKVAVHTFMYGNGKLFTNERNKILQDKYILDVFSDAVYKQKDQGFSSFSVDHEVNYAERSLVFIVPREEKQYV